MGKKPAIFLSGMIWAGLAATGCQSSNGLAFWNKGTPVADSGPKSPAADAVASTASTKGWDSRAPRPIDASAEFRTASTKGGAGADGSYAAGSVAATGKTKDSRVISDPAVAPAGYVEPASKSKLSSRTLDPTPAATTPDPLPLPDPPPTEPPKWEPTTTRRTTPESAPQAPKLGILVVPRVPPPSVPSQPLFEDK